MGRPSCCEKEHTNKGAWTEEEDKRLIKYMIEHGKGRWSSVPKAAGLQRCGKSCRSRWMNYLRPDLKRGNFSELEDEIIIQLHRILGSRWSIIAAQLPGRTDNEIKNYWNTHIKRKLLSPGIDPQTHRPQDISSCLDSEAAEKARGLMNHTFQSYHQPPGVHMCAALSGSPPTLSDHPWQDGMMQHDSSHQQVDKTHDARPLPTLSDHPGQDEMMQYDSSHQQVDETNDARLLPTLSDHPRQDEMIQHDSSHQHHPRNFEMMQHDSSHQQVDETNEARPLPTFSDHPRQDEMMQHDSWHQQVDETNDARPIINCAIQTDVLGSNQEGRLMESGCATNKGTAVRTLDVEYGISRGVLEQHSEKKLKDVAKALGVSRSTLKRICRKYEINRWPPKRSKGPNDSGIHQDSVHSAANKNTDAHNIPNSRTVEDGASVIVKATYREDTFKFQLSLSAKKKDLEQQVTKRLNPSVGNFRIKYLDEENESVSVACDEDLKLCIDTCKLLGKTTIRMSIN